MSESAILVNVKANIATLTFDQPNSRANVLSAALWTEFGQVLDGLAHRPGIRGLILASAKPGIFIAGADLRELADADPANPEPMRTYIDLGHHVLDTMESLPFPTVALIDGAAMGGGLEVALSCDICICGSNPDVQLGFPEIQLGLLPGWGGTQRLPRLIGVEDALLRLLSGESYDADDPPPEDLVLDSVPSVELFDKAVNWLSMDDLPPYRELKREPVPAEELPTAEFLAELRDTLDTMDERMKPAAAEIVKVVLEGALTDLASALRLETAAFLRLAGTPNSRQMIADYLAQRKKG